MLETAHPTSEMIPVKIMALRNLNQAKDCIDIYDQ